MRPTLREGDPRRREKEVAVEKAEGRIKEAYGALVGDEAKKEEGRALQRKAKRRPRPSRGRGQGAQKPRPGRPSGSATGRRARAASWET
jgi:hypothetical protein